jgi:hypothetical protein
MPQPYRSVAGDTITYGPHTLTERPDLALHIAIIASLWGTIDDRIARLFVPLIGNCYLTVTAMFFAVASLSARLDILKTAARVRASKELYAELDGSLVPEIRARARERVPIIHGLWGISERHPDALISSPSFHERPTPRKTLVYKRNDFIEIERRHLLLLDHLDAYNERLWTAVLERVESSQQPQRPRPPPKA